jgi:hypothetical protein
MKNKIKPSKKPTFEKCFKQGLHSRTNKTECRVCGKYACSHCAHHKFKYLTGGVHPITKVDQGPRMGLCENCFKPLFLYKIPRVQEIVAKIMEVVDPK